MILLLVGLRLTAGDLRLKAIASMHVLPSSAENTRRLSAAAMDPARPLVIDITTSTTVTQHDSDYAFKTLHT